MKSFDDIFKENVEKTFSDYNADHLADQGWNSFVAAGKGKRKLRLVVPLWARAASIALFIATGALITLLVMNRKLTEDDLTASVTEPKKELPAIINSGSEGPILSVKEEPVNSIKEEPANAIIGEPANAIIVEPANPTIEEPTNPIIGGSTKPIIGETTTEPLRRNGGVRYSENRPAETLSEKPGETQALAIGEVITELSDTTVFPLVSENRSLFQGDSMNLTFEEALKELLKGEDEETISEEEVKRSGRTTFMAGMSGLLAHVQDAATAAPGVSLGFYMEQKITDKISVRPGLALALNSLGIDNGTDSYEFAYSVPLIDGNSGTLDSYTGTLSMLAMELPLNFIFKVYEKGRSGIYLSAGTSTMIYISQQYTGDFVNEYTQNYFDVASGSMTSEKRYSTVTVNNDYGAFSRTDFFGLANFSAGYTLPYGTTGVMLIEPFLQFPLSDLTALDLRVRYGGVSLKIRFGSNKSE